MSSVQAKFLHQLISYKFTKIVWFSEFWVGNLWDFGIVGKSFVDLYILGLEEAAIDNCLYRRPTLYLNINWFEVLTSSILHSPVEGV